MLLADVLKEPAKFDCLKSPIVLELENLTYSPFHAFAFVIFLLAIIHTLSVYRFHAWARQLELKQKPKRLGGERSMKVHLLYFLSEVEVVFAIWVIPLFLCMGFSYGWDTSFEYINTRDYTEALFVVVILAMASTKPIIHIAEKTISWIARGLGQSLSAWWFILLTVGPILGSFITEAAAMVLSALLLSHQFYLYRPSRSLSYATLALLFVNVSVGGVLTNFASPAVLILSHFWHWSLLDIFTQFGWKVIVGIVLSNLLYWAYFRKELHRLSVKKKAMVILEGYTSKPPPAPIPHWISFTHALFMGWIVCVSQYPAIFIASFLFFVGFHQATRTHQHSLRLARPMLIGLFLAGLVIHAGLQGWWVYDLLSGLSPNAVLGVSLGLAGFNDNATISYLATLIPNTSEMFRYAIFTGVISGGGLTVIANAPNPAGFAILRRHFPEGIRPLRLFTAGLIPAAIFYGIFYLFGPLF